MLTPLKTAVTAASLLFFLIAPAIAENKTFIVNTGFTPPVSTYFEKVLNELGKRANLYIQLVEVSAERSLRLVSRGKADAECCRIHHVISPNYPTLVDVPDSFYEMNWVAFASDSDIEVKQWQDLEKYSATAVTGYKLAVNKVRQFSPAPHIVGSHESMFRMINRGRSQVGVSSYLSGLKVLKDMRLDESISILQPPVFTISLTLQLHPQHADKKELFLKLIDEMKQDGTINRIYDEIIAQYKN